MLPAIDEAVPYDDEVVAGDVLDLGGGVTFVPAVGWGIEDGIRTDDEPRTGVGPGQGTAILIKGGLTLRARTGRFDGDPAALLDRINDTNESLHGERGFYVASTAQRVTTNDGHTGVQEAFTSTTGDGLIAAFVFDGIGVELTVVGSKGAFVEGGDDVEEMFHSIAYVPEQ